MTIQSISISDLLTVSRPSARSRVGPSGLIETVGSGLIARDFTPAGAARGLQIEPQTTNLATYSEDFSNAVWQKFSSSASANAVVAPDGATTADKFVEAAATAIHYWTRTHTIVAGTLHTWTVFAKAAGRTYLQLFVDNGSGVGANATFDLSAGAVTQSQQLGGTSGLVSSIKDAGNGWWRLRLTTYIGAGNTSLWAGFVLATVAAPGIAHSYAGDGTSGVYLWGAQLEVLGVPTSYMPAGASSAVRYTDDISLSAADVVTPGQGGLYFEGTPVAAGTAQVLGGLYWTGGDLIETRRSAAGRIVVEAVSGGVQVAFLDLGAHTDGALVKVAFGWADNDLAARMLGGSLLTDTGIVMPTADATLRLGSRPGPVYALNGHLRRAAAWPTRAIMTNALIGDLVA